jgi:cofilin
MASGVAVNSDCVQEFQDLKLRKKYTYIIFNLNSDSTEIVVEKTVKQEDYEEFIKDLPENECRWAIYDFGFQKEDGSARNKITFISWSPDNAKIKQKMLFASSREALKRSFNGIAVEIQGSDYSEVSYEAVLEKANRGN